MCIRDRFILAQETDRPLEEEAARYISEEKGVESAADALQGAKDIIAEAVSDEADYRIYIRSITFEEGKITSTAKDEKAASVYEMYYAYAVSYTHLDVYKRQAYVVSRKCFLIRRGVMKLMIFTMFFSGGLIPLFFVIRNTGLYNTIWVSSIPYAVSAYNMIIMKTFFESIPESLEEAAIIDGANDFTVFSRIIMPLSKPVVAVMILYYGCLLYTSRCV